MSKLQIIGSVSGYDESFEFDDDVTFNADNINAEVLARMKVFLGASKIKAKTNHYMTRTDHELYVTDLLMGNGVTFMCVWVRAYGRVELELA